MERPAAAQQAAADSQRKLGLVMVGVVVLLAAGAAGIMVWAETRGGGPASPAGREHEAHPGAPGPSARGAPATTSATAASDTSCAQEIMAADAVVAAARIGIGHWNEHVQARTDLLSGRKPKSETSAIWKRTRLAGPADLERYDDALTAYAATRGACAEAGSAASPARDDLVACKKRAELLTRALRAAGDGMGDWRSHQRAMAAHNAGEFDAIHAQELWVAAWTAAPVNIRAFYAADGRLSAAPACSG